MAATRKLQGEIDRCLKKVAEGVETFEDIWKKVHNATNSNQKQKHLQEKYEADLKKEIKKLQRLRDQIKSWIASAEIKDKTSLLENRRLIETQMERFKVVERETKTKAYSKEGLGAAQKMDPAQRIKDEARNWLTSSISSLQIQIDQYESEIESLLAGKKKRLDRDKQERMDDLRSKLDRHKFHVTKLETLLRLLDNDGVEAEQVNKIKDDVEYYIDSSQEPDFEENEFIYDDIIGLDEVELSGTGISLGIPSSATTDSNNSNETSGSPSSVTSGGSPSQSPITVQHSLPTTSSTTTTLQSQQQLQQSSASSAAQFQQQQSNGSTSNNSYTSEPAASATTTTTIAGLPSDATAPTSSSEKQRAKSESNASIKTKLQPQQQQLPIKPTAVRAVSNKAVTGSSDTQVNKIVSSTPSKNQQQQHAQPTAAAIVAAATATVANSNSNSNSNSASAVVVSGHNPAVQPHAPAPSLNTSASSAAATTTAVHNTNSSSNIQGQTVIQATTTIAFAAVAKHSTSLLENGPVPQQTTPTVAAIVGAAAQAQQQQQQQQQATATQITNLQTNSAHLQNGLPVALSSNVSAVDAISLKTMAQEAINRSVLDSSSSLATQQQQQQTVNIDTRQQQQQQQQQSLLQQHFNTDTTANQQQQQQQQQQQNTPSSIAAAVAAVAATNGPTVTSVGNLINLANVTNQTSTTAATTNAKATQQQQQQQLPTNEAHIPPLLGVAPLGPAPLHKDHQMQFQLMEAAFYHLPQPQDTEKLTTYFHRSPVQTPPHYPQSQLPIYDTVEFYQRLSTETLFFVFYYMEGSKAQYLAAKALKKQSWRFHTKYMMWFQRHEEPKIINDDYEQGTYIYFDYEKWSQRKKEGFTFEYKYLEDKELN